MKFALESEDIFNYLNLQWMAVGAFGEHGHHAVKLVVLPKRTVLEYAIIPLKLMVESLVMVPTKTKILAK